MTKEELIASSEKNIVGTYRRQPVVFVRGEGAHLWDSEGKEYVDFVAGIAVCSLGHSHPRVVEAIRKQAGTLTHVSNLYYTEPQIRFAEMLVENSFADRVFFCNSGAEANEAAIKLARKYGHDNLNGKYEILTMKGSFHGRTLAAITATGQEKFHVGFSPLPEGFRYIPFNDVQCLEKAISKKTCAVLLEPIQGEGGVRVPDEGYLRAVRDICDRKGILMILDEVQTGMGRTGKLFGYEHYGVTPDIMTLAKALGNGIPAGALTATEKVAASFGPGTHASTFGGNPLAMAAAIATLETILEEGFLEGCRKMGEYLQERLWSLRKDHSVVQDVRGKGLLVGLDLTVEGNSIVTACLERGVLINCTFDHILRMVPPLVITRQDVDRLVQVLDEVIVR
ncbi:MAG TPA: acetylornithine transaminase [Syntrophales bacterium]|nr:acetylornithine transaminase [Syntrophales bacterium]